MKTEWLYFPNHPRCNNYGAVRKYIILAEKALGKHLPSKSNIHHIDGNTLNNLNSNLIICEDIGYHKLLHKRTRSYIATGNPDLSFCPQCNSWKKIDEFAGNRPGWCKPCHSKKQSEYKRNKFKVYRGIP